jgi:glycosyltransferase involved in cell wall biosynthesis
MISNSKVKILFIVPRFSSINRGVEIFAKELISRLDKKKYEITLISDNKEIVWSVNNLNTRFVKREFFYFVDRFTGLFKRLLNFLNIGSSSDIEALSFYIFSKNKLKNSFFDIIIPLGGYWTYKLAKITSGKVISIGQSGPVKKWLLYSDLYVSLTHYDLVYTQKICPDLKCILIPNGIDVSKFEVLENKNHKKIIICVAALVEDKRHEILFNAMRLLPKNIQLVCIGSGPLENRLKSHPLVFEGRVIFKSVSYEEMPYYYSQSNVFTLASLDEAFGIVFIEAMASGLPIVAHNGPRQKFVIGENGIFCNTSDPEMYAKALMTALNRNKSLNVRNEAIARYSWDNISKEYIKLFENILN